MAKRIIWTKRATREIREMISYLKVNQSYQAAENLLDEINKRILFLERFPESGRKSKKAKTIRFVPVGKHRRMFYRVHGNKIIVSWFFDTRQDPSKSIF